MANGGHICCEYCTYNRSKRGSCDIWGIDTDGAYICRSFRMPKQSHSAARKEWPVLDDFEPGFVYGIENSVYSDWKFIKMYKVVPVSKGDNK